MEDIDFDTLMFFKKKEELFSAQSLQEMLELKESMDLEMRHRILERCAEYGFSNDEQISEIETRAKGFKKEKFDRKKVSEKIDRKIYDEIADLLARYKEILGHSSKSYTQGGALNFNYNFSSIDEKLQAMLEENIIREEEESSPESELAQFSLLKHRERGNDLRFEVPTGSQFIVKSDGIKGNDLNGELPHENRKPLGINEGDRGEGHKQF